jgi:hypothetical protein
VFGDIVRELTEQKSNLINLAESIADKESSPIDRLRIWAAGYG